MTKRRDKPADDFEWPPKHAEYWLGLAATAGVSDKMARFSYAISTGMSQTHAARWAYGYQQDARSRGYALARSKGVTLLLTMAEQDGWQSPNDLVTEDEKSRLLNSLMRSGDPAVRMKAIEISDRRRVAAEEAKRSEQRAQDPLECLDAIAEEISPACAWVLAVKEGLGWKPKAHPDWSAVLDDLDKWRAVAIERRNYSLALAAKSHANNGA